MQKEVFIYDEEKNVILALAVALLLTTYATPVLAAENPVVAGTAVSVQTIVPLWENTKTVVPSISISGKRISVSVYISPISSTTTTTGKLYLEKKSGNGWTKVTSWTIDATGKVDVTKTYIGTIGVTYRTRVVVTTGADKIDVASNERTA